MKMQEDNMTADKNDDLQAHYDFDYTKAKPNRFAERIQQESITIMLDPDVAAIFPTSESVNETLRALMAALQNMPLVTANQEQISVVA